MITVDSFHLVIDLQSPPQSDSELDYRRSHIDIIAIDRPTGFKRSEEMSRQVSGIEPLRATIQGEGVIRLYREYVLDEDESIYSKEDKLEHTISGDDTMISIVAVPTYFTATDLLGFIGEPYLRHISHIRILKSDVSNRFLVLIKFEDALSSAEFQYNFDGKPFNSMEPETCHAIFLKSITFTGSESQLEAMDEGKKLLIPFLMKDPFTTPKMESGKSTKNSKIIELPTCPVCLERMDATVTGLLTIPCQHTFHCQCLSKWKDDTCPICRYSNNISNHKVRKSFRSISDFNRSRRSRSSVSSRSSPFNLSQNVGDNEVFEHCSECDSESNLWICLICGNVGCGRYTPEQHSLKHFVNTGHCFAMELTTSRVWDYAGDNYVHRLVTNESDGKIVELPDKSGSNYNNQAIHGSSSNDDKVDQIGLEYSQLLISQLASQREYYESQLDIKENHRYNSIDIESFNSLQSQVENLTSGLKELNMNVIPSLKAKITYREEKLMKLSKDLSTSESLNNAFSKKIEHLTKVNKDLQSEVKDLTDKNTGLNEQVTDLMFFLDSQEKFKNEPHDIKEGQILIRKGSSSSKKSRKK